MNERIYEKEGTLLKPKEEIIRCKDCKHWSHRIIGYCNYWNRGMAEAEDFCSYGKREEREEE